MSEGLISLYRKINESWLWDEKPFDKRSAWIDLVIMSSEESSYKDLNGRIIYAKEGQVVTSSRRLSERWGWKKDSVIRFMSDLEAFGMIEKDSDKNRTIITILDYKKYNPSRKKKREETLPQDEIQIQSDFGKLVEIYPNTKGKAKAYGAYRRWVTAGNQVNGKRIVLTNRDVWFAIKKYIDYLAENKIDPRYVKHFDTFMREGILDYVDTGDGGNG